MHWRDVGYLYIASAIIVGLAVAFALDVTRRKRVLERLGHSGQISRMVDSFASGRRGWRAFLTILGIALVTVALARPEVVAHSDLADNAVDIAVVMDFSKSMLARDVYPSRSERIKLEVKELLQGLPGERVAIVGFAGSAVHYPLTTDFEAAKILFEELSPLDMAPGSDIGEAVRLARCLVIGSSTDKESCAPRAGESHVGGRVSTSQPAERSRAIVIFTDGEDTAGRIRSEMEAAARARIAIFIVGVGTTTGARIPEFDSDGKEAGWKKARDGRGEFVTHLNERGLRELVSAVGGRARYYQSDPARIGINKEVVRDLRSQVREWSGGEDKVRSRHMGGSSRRNGSCEEKYQWLLFPGFMALLIEACISERRSQGRMKP